MKEYLLTTKSIMLTMLAGMLLSPISAKALDCTAAPDCASLGYTKSAEDCENMPTVKCPTDTSKVFCKKAPFEFVSACVAGSIIGNDKKCYNLVDMPSTVKPIAVVFDPNNYLAVALTDAMKSGSAGSEKMAWSSQSCNIPGLNSCLNNDVTCDPDGKANTTAILATNGGCSGTTYAANAANAYSPSSCTSTFCKAGQWFLPSIRDVYSIRNGATQISSTLKALSSQGATDIANNHYVSNQVNANTITAYGFYDNNTGTGGKTNTASYVRPVIYYGEEQAREITCTTGSIVYGDGKCYSGTPTSVQPVAVVFDTTNKLAVALTDVKKDGSSGSEFMSWSDRVCEIPNLTNCTNSESVKTSCGIDGKSNTTAILASEGGCIDTAYAAHAAHTYQPSNCTATFCKKGNWFLPSLKELKAIYDSSNIINRGLTQVGQSQLSSNSYWASTEYSSDNAWTLHLSKGGYTQRYKMTGDSYVRPVVKYQLPSLDESGGGI